MKRGHSETANAEGGSTLRAGGDFETHGAIQSRHADFATERGCGEGNRHLAGEIHAIAGENFVLLDMNHHIQVAGGSASQTGLATARAAQAGVAVDTGRDFDFNAAGFFDPALALAGRAGFFDDASRAVAGGAGLRDLEKASRGNDLTTAATGRAGDGLAALLRAGAGAGLAGIHLANFNFLLTAFGGLLERNLHIVAQIGSALATGGVHAATAAEKLLKHSTATAAAEDFFEKIERIVEAPATAHAILKCRVTVAVVSGALVRVTKGLVGFPEFLKFLLCLVVAGVFVRVVFHRELAVGALQILLADVAIDAQNLVVVPLFAHCAPLETITDAARRRRSLSL